MSIRIEGKEVRLPVGNIPTSYGHLYLVFNDAYVIRAGPGSGPGGSIRAEDSYALNASLDGRPTNDRAGRGSREIDFGGRDEYAVWDAMRQFAAELNKASISYEAFGLNSNSFINTVLALVGIDLKSNMPGAVWGVAGPEKYQSKELFIEFNFTIRGADTVDLLYGRGGAQTFYGNGGDDVLSGGDGNDFLHGGAGMDQLAGGAGRDYLVGSGSGDTYHVALYDGFDTIDDTGGQGTDTLGIYVGARFSRIDLSWFVRAGDDLLVQIYDQFGRLALDVRIAGMGTSAGRIEDVALYVGDEQSPSEVRSLKEIWDVLTAQPAPVRPTPAQTTGSPAPVAPSSSSSFTYLGTALNNKFTGGSGVDVAAGLDGADDLRGQSGDDQLLGNKGNDTIAGDGGDDLLVDDDPGFLGVDTLLGGTGKDSLVFYGAAKGGVDRGDGGSGTDLALIKIDDRSRDMKLTETNGKVTIQPKSSTAEGATELTNIETIVVHFGSGADFASGGDQDYHLEGRGGDDDLNAGDGDDYLSGGDGDDTLDGDRGVDYFDGGNGDDRIEFDLSGESQDLTFDASKARRSSGFTMENGTHVRNGEDFDITSGSGDDTIRLGRGRDSAHSGSGSDLITTEGEGTDSIDGGSGYDRLIVDYSWSDERARTSFSTSSGTLTAWHNALNYAAAEDRLTSSNVEEYVIIGGSADDRLIGGNGDDELTGNGGDDSLTGGVGYDVMRGGAGNDSFNSHEEPDWMDGGSGLDTVTIQRLGARAAVTFRGDLAAKNSGYTLSDGTHVRNMEALALWTGSGSDFIVLTGLGSNFLYLSDGTNGLQVDFNWSTEGLSGAYVDGSTEYRISAGSQSDVRAFGLSYLYLIGSSVADTINGIDNAPGSPGDRLAGGDGNDLLSGGGGDDVLSGGRGNDRLDGGGGSDTASFGDAGAGVVVRLGTSAAQNLGASGFDTLISIENLEGSRFADSLIGDADTNALSGGDGDDLLYGGSGNDVLDGGSGRDNLFGQGGADIFVVRSPDDSALASYDIIRDFVSGTDKVDISALYSATLRLALSVASGFTYLHFDVDGDGSWDGMLAASNKLQATDLILGATASVVGLSMYGADTNDVLKGGAGSDLLDGRAGADSMTGGLGNDTYLVDNTSDTVTEAAGGGNDVIHTSVSYTVRDNVETMVLAGTAPISGTGSGAADTIFGNESANTIDGVGGNDILDGQAGDDTLRGGVGNDLLIGGAGSDLIDGGAGVDWASYAAAGSAISVSLSKTNPQNTGGAGSDTLIGVENLQGSAFNDVLIGDGAANTLQGAVGNDALSGGLGDDCLIGGAGNDTIDGGAGVDAASYIDASGAVSVSLAIVGGQNTLGAGTDSLVNIESLVGSMFGDALVGNGLANTLEGGGGRDSLTGGAGGDSFVFRAAADSAVGSADTILDFGSGDRIRLSEIDANALLVGDQAFAFIGTSSFAGVAGQVRYVVGAAGCQVFGDVDGDGIADFEIFVAGATSLVATSFIL